MADAAALLGNATTRILYDDGAYQRTSSGGAAVAARRLRARPRDPRLRPGGTAAVPGGPAGHPLPVPASPTATGSGGRSSARRWRRRTRAPARRGGPPRAGRSTTTRGGRSAPTSRSSRPRPPSSSPPRPGSPRSPATTRRAASVAMLHPDSTWEKTTFGPWLGRQWDGDDTVAGRRPALRPRRRRLLHPAARRRGRSRPGTTCASAASTARRPKQQAAQQDAARKTAPFAATPATVALRLARPGVPGGRGQRPGSPLPGPHRLRHRGHAPGRLRRARQARGGARAAAAGPRTAGSATSRAPTWRAGPSTGSARTAARGARCPDVTGQAIGAWDARRHAFRLVYDPARRPTHRYVSTDGAAEILLDLNVYGEGQPAANLCGRLFRGYDRAGYPETSAVDFTGNPVAGYPAARRGLPRLGRLDAAGQPDDRRRRSTPRRPPPAWCRPGTAAGTGSRAPRVFDALSRPVQQVTPHSPRCCPDVIQPGYDEGGPAPPGRRLAAAGRRAGRAARPGHRRPARRHRHRLQRQRPAGLRRLRQRHHLGVRVRPADVPAHHPDDHPAGFLPRRPADGPGPVVLLRPRRQRHRPSATTPTRRTSSSSATSGSSRPPATPTTRCTG